MISSKLKTIFALSIPVLIAHGLEEYFNGFYNLNPDVKFFFGYFDTLPTSQAVFLFFQIALWILLLISAILISNEKWRLRLMILPGLVYFYEFGHIFRAISIGDYYPGVITAVAFPVIAFFFWKEFITNYKSRS